MSEDLSDRVGEPRAEDLIPLLHQIQRQFHYLPEPELRSVARHLRIPLTAVFHVATFFNCFSLEPVGRHVVQVCLGTACHVRGGPRVLDRILRDLKPGQTGTTGDMAFTVRSVHCIGCCGLAPVVQVDNQVHRHMPQARVAGLLKKYRPAPTEEPSQPVEV